MTDYTKIQWKIFFKDPQEARPEEFFKIFNTWIPGSPEIFVDVADYQHVHDGPWVILVGHYVDYVLDVSDGRAGLMYSRKRLLPGEKGTLKEGLTALLKRASTLSCAWVPDQCQLTMNDRALYPNNNKTRETVKKETLSLMAEMTGDTSEAHCETNPQKRVLVTLITRKSLKIYT